MKYAFTIRIETENPVELGIALAKIIKVLSDGDPQVMAELVEKLREELEVKTHTPE